jgi:hypothetical protein
MPAMMEPDCCILKYEVPGLQYSFALAGVCMHGDRATGRPGDRLLGRPALAFEDGKDVGMLGSWDDRIVFECSERFLSQKGRSTMHFHPWDGI